MPRGNEAPPEHQLAKILVSGGGKVGKSDWAARAVEGGFNVLYLNGDVAAQTIAGLKTDKTHPVKPELVNNIYLLNMQDELIDGAMNHRFVNSFKRFCAASPKFRWNDSKSREFEILTDGDPCQDVIWEIMSGRMDHTSVLVIDSWTSLAQSCMTWASIKKGVSLEEVIDDRDKMRDIYQAAGEKLTYYLTMIRSAKCHVIVIGHPREFTKTEKQAGKTARESKEADMKVLWTKTVPASCSNNHAFGMSIYFTDLAWIEVDGMGNYKIDFRPTTERLSGSHLNFIGDARGEGSFCNVVKKLGGTLPGVALPPDRWIKIHEPGFSLAESTKKPALILGAQNGASPGAPTSQIEMKSGGLNLNLAKQ